MPKSKKAPEGQPATVDDLIKQQEADGQTLQAAGSVPETAAEAAGPSMFDAFLEMYSRARALIGDDPNDKMIKTHWGTVFEKIYTLTTTAIHLLPEIVKQPEYETIRTTTWKETQSNPEFIELYKRATQEALRAAAAELKINIAPAIQPLLPKQKSIKTNTFDFPLDKPNSEIWNAAKYGTEGQLSFAFKIPMEKRGSEQEIDFIFSINFKAVEGSIKSARKITAFDKYVYIIAASLFNAGNEYITIRQIYKYMTGKSDKPALNQIKKIDDSITKLSAAWAYMNNLQEIKAGYSYPVLDYDGPLLPCERVRATVNGQTVDAAIHLFREPPLISFARGRGQITTIPVRVMQIQNTKITDNSVALQDYLLRRILEIKGTPKKGKKAAPRILFKTIFDNIGLSDKTESGRKERQRAKKTIGIFLEQFKTGLSFDYTMDQTGIDIIFP